MDGGSDAAVVVIMALNSQSPPDLDQPTVSETEYRPSSLGRRGSLPKRIPES